MNPLQQFTRSYFGNNLNATYSRQFSSKVEIFDTLFKSRFYKEMTPIEKWVDFWTRGGAFAGAVSGGTAGASDRIKEKDFIAIPLYSGFGAVAVAIPGAVVGRIAGLLLPIGAPFAVLSTPFIVHSILTDKPKNQNDSK